MPFSRDLDKAKEAYKEKDVNAMIEAHSVIHEKAPEKITALLNQFCPGVPVNLNMVANLAEIPVDIAKSIILGILEHMPDVGEFLELEQVFIRKTEVEIQIDKLLEQFQDW